MNIDMAGGYLDVFSRMGNRKGAYQIQTNWLDTE